MKRENIDTFALLGDDEFWDALMACGIPLEDLDDAMMRAVDQLEIDC